MLLTFFGGQEKQENMLKMESYRLSSRKLRNFYAKVTDFRFMMNILACNERRREK